MSYALVLGVLVALLVIAGGVAALFWWVRRPTPVRHEASRPLPLFSHSKAAIWMRDDEDDDEDDTTAELISARQERQERAGTPVPSWSVPLPDVGAQMSRARADRSPASAPAPSAPRPARSTAPANEPTPQGTVQFSVPSDATLQFLPGRLEIVTGSDAGREVRFVRSPGTDATRVTFGRSPGEPYRHVQLADATVSRQHAEMTLRGGHWFLVNHSETNPVLHNGEVLSAKEGVRLSDGDRLEMGAVTFRFRQ